MAAALFAAEAAAAEAARRAEADAAETLERAVREAKKTSARAHKEYTSAGRLVAELDGCASDWLLLTLAPSVRAPADTKCHSAAAKWTPRPFVKSGSAGTGCCACDRAQLRENFSAPFIDVGAHTQGVHLRRTPCC